MSEDQAAKVIQFPGKQKETSRNETPVAQAPAAPAVAAALPKPRARANFNSGIGLFAIILATVAVNRFAFRAGDVASSRVLASANLTLERDAAWEKSLAERLAQPGSLRSVAQVGRGATLVEQMRFATLEDKYAIDWRADHETVASVRAQGQPLVIDRASFLKKYGQLFDTSFVSAARAGESTVDGHRVETYELRGAGGRTLAEARFEYDENQGLLSLVTVQK